MQVIDNYACTYGLLLHAHAMHEVINTLPMLLITLEMRSVKRCSKTLLIDYKDWIGLNMCKKANSNVIEIKASYESS